jgi:hypothetical protein
MMNHRRRKISRETVNVEAVVYWQDASGQERSMSSCVSDLSEAGVRLEGPERMEPGQKISINLSLSGCPRAEATVCYCILGIDWTRMCGGDYSTDFIRTNRTSCWITLRPDVSLGTSWNTSASRTTKT